MSRKPVPFTGDIVTIDGVLNDRYRKGRLQSEACAVAEIINAPEYRALVDTISGITRTIREDGSRGEGRTPSVEKALKLGILVVAIVLNRPLAAARERVYSDHYMREIFGLPPLTPAEERALANKQLEIPKGFVSTSTLRHFIKTETENNFPFIEMAKAAMLRVAADVIHRHNLSCSWVGIDGKRMRGATDKAAGDEGTDRFGRDSSESWFNQRWTYPVTLGSVPIVLDVNISPPGSELKHWVHDGIPALAQAGDTLGTLLTELARQENPAAPAHPGLRRAAVASDGALANEPGARALIKAGFTPAMFKPKRNSELKLAERPITARRDGKPVEYPLRNDGAILCPYCKVDQRVADRTPMEPRSGDWGEDIRVVCTDPTCEGAKARKIPLVGPDRNDYAPGSSITRGTRSYTKVSLLPVWSPEYIARRFLTLQRVEITHSAFEAKYGLGAKNPGIHRRKTSGTHRNQVWWTVAALVWNIQIRLNLDEGIGHVVPVPDIEEINPKNPHEAPRYTVESVVKSHWRKHHEIQHRKAKRKATKLKDAQKLVANQNAQPEPGMRKSPEPDDATTAHIEAGVLAAV